MRPTHVLVLALLAATVCASLAFVRAPIERINVPEGAGYRRYLSDPLGKSTSLYAALLNIGGANYRLILDTGSGNTYIISQGCAVPNTEGEFQGCQYSTNFYSGSAPLVTYDSGQCGASISFGGQSNICGLESEYADGSYVNAAARRDSLSMGPWSGDVNFGAAYATSDDFIVSGTDGIWGMWRPNPSWVFLQKGPLGSLIDAGMPRVFAMCLASAGGDLHLGGYDASYADGGIKWYTFDASHYQYRIPNRAMRVGPTTVSSTSQQVVFDSGSTISYLPTAVYNSMIQAIQAQCNGCNMAVFSSNLYQNVNPSSYPTISLDFTDTTGSVNTLTLTGAQYLMQNPNNAGQYTSGIGESTVWLFGQSFMRHWYNIFDIEFGAIGLGNLASGKCTATLPPVSPTLNVVTPSTPKPPVSTGGLTPVANNPAPRSASPTGSTPVSGPSSVPTSGTTPNFDSPSGASAIAPLATLLVIAIAALALLF